MEEVLETIADNVASLVLALSAAESARPGAQLQLPNLVPATHMIKEALDGMCEAARLTSEDPVVPPETRVIVDANAAELVKDSAALVAGATLAAENPARSSEGVKAAIKAAKSILQKVVTLVMLEDQVNIQIFFGVSKRAADVVRRISAAESPSALGAVVAEVPTIVGEFLRRARRRAESTKMPDERDALTTALEQFSAESSRHIAAAKENAARPSDSARRAANESGNRCVAQIDAVLAVVRDIFDRNSKFIGAAFAFKAPTSVLEDEITRGARELAQKLEAVGRKACAGDPDSVAATRGAVETANAVLAAARAAAEAERDPLKKHFINKGIDELQSLIPQVVQQVKAVLRDPSNAQAVADLNDLIKLTKNATDTLAAAVIGSPERALATGAAGIVKGMQELKRDCDAKDIESAGRDVKRLEHMFDRHIDLAAKAAELEQDPEKKKEMLENLEALKRLKQKFMAAARKFLTNPTPEALKQLEEMMALTQQALLAITPAHLAAGALAQEIAAELDALVLAVKNNDSAEAIAHARNVAAAMRAQVAIAETFAQHLSPERKAQIYAQIAHGKEVAARMVEAMKDALQHPGSAAHIARLEAASEATKKATADLAEMLRPSDEEAAAERARLAREHAKALSAVEEEARLRALARAEEERRLAASRLKVDGPKDAAIYAAAVKVEHGVPMPSSADPDSPYGKLLSLSHNIAQLMAQLSAFAAQGNKQGMIATSRALAQTVQDVILQARAIAAKCTDARLKNDVLNFAQACQNYVVQVKIMAAVKAASEDNDPTVQEQLVTAATGLANSVVNTVNSCTSASIHKSVRMAKK